jgi:alcohol dehydrogenase
VAVFGCGGVGLSAVLGAAAAGADPIVAIDVASEKLEAALGLGATDVVQWTGGPDETAEAVHAVAGGGVDYAIEATGRTEVARAAFLSTRARGAAVLIGIPGADDEVSLPALSIPRMERRVLGSVYGSARPERDFPALLALYRRGRLPLDRLVAARLPLAGVEEAFAMMRNGTTGRVVLDLDGAAA